MTFSHYNILILLIILLLLLIIILKNIQWQFPLNECTIWSVSFTSCILVKQWNSCENNNNNKFLNQFLLNITYIWTLEWGKKIYAKVLSYSLKMLVFQHSESIIAHKNKTSHCFKCK